MQGGTVRVGVQPRSVSKSRDPAEAGPGRQDTNWLRLHHSFLEVLRRPESNLLAGLDLDAFARCRVATHPCRALPKLQEAEARDADARAFLQMLADVGHHLRQDDFRLGLRKA